MDEDACSFVRVVVRTAIEMLPVEVLTLSAVKLGLFEASTETLPVEVLMVKSDTLMREAEMTIATLEPEEEPETVRVPVFGFEEFVTVVVPVKKGKNSEG